jgi:hypothetical protein
MSFWHFACAALNPGEDGFVPALSWKPPSPGSGSGKLGKPLERMHLANASSPERAAPGPADTRFAALE